MRGFNTSETVRASIYADWLKKQRKPKVYARKYGISERTVNLIIGYGLNKKIKV